MCFSIRRKTKDKLAIKIDQEDIEVVSDFKFLGIILDSQLNSNLINTLKSYARP